jgi:hypothetical protein
VSNESNQRLLVQEIDCFPLPFFFYNKNIKIQELGCLVDVDLCNITAQPSTHTKVNFRISGFSRWCGEKKSNERRERTTGQSRLACYNAKGPRLMTVGPALAADIYCDLPQTTNAAHQPARPGTHTHTHKQ